MLSNFSRKWRNVFSQQFVYESRNLSAVAVAFQQWLATRALVDVLQSLLEMRRCVSLRLSKEARELQQNSS
jgi:hypothetical protein